MSYRPECKYALWCNSIAYMVISTTQVYKPASKGLHLTQTLVVASNKQPEQPAHEHYEHLMNTSYKGVHSLST